MRLDEITRRPKLIEIAREEFRDIDDPDGYVYHVTTLAAARQIVKEGFVLGGRYRSAFSGGYANYSKGKVFFCERDGVSFWKYRIETNLEQMYDRPPKVAVVRVAKAVIESLLQPDELGTRDCHAQCYFIDQPFPTASPAAG